MRRVLRVLASVRRPQAELAVLVLMIGVAAVDANLFTALIALALPPLAVITWTVYLYLRSKASLARDLGLSIPALEERVRDARTLAFAATSGGVAGVLVVLRGAGNIPIIPRQAYLVIIAFALFEIAVPGISWIETWRGVWLPQLRERVRGREADRLREDRGDR